MLTVENSLLIVIDVQGNLATAVADHEAANAAILRLIAGMKALEVPILLTAQAPEKIGHTIPAVRELLPVEEELPRMTFSVGAEENIRAALKKHNRRQLILCGFETHICLYQSSMQFLLEGYEVYLAADATSSRTLLNKETALRELSRQGVHLTSAEMALYSLLRSAAHPAFKTISRLIK